MHDTLMDHIEAENERLGALIDELNAKMEQVPPEQRTQEMRNAHAERYLELLQQMKALNEKFMLARKAIDDAEPPQRPA
jgi:outer membrane murein-binding lipoprotein Lpp